MHCYHTNIHCEAVVKYKYCSKYTGMHAIVGKVGTYGNETIVVQEFACFQA